jgi:hypothetical protein
MEGTHTNKRPLNDSDLDNQQPSKVYLVSHPLSEFIIIPSDSTHLSTSVLSAPPMKGEETIVEPSSLGSVNVVIRIDSLSFHPGHVPKSIL